MLIGAMNHPARDPAAEIDWMARLGLDFIDLTLEPPGAPSWSVDARAIRRVLESYNMQAVGHTAYYLPIASAIRELRLSAVEELRRCMRVFRDVGARWMNVHPDRHVPFHDREFCIRMNQESLRTLLVESEKTGVGLMIENLPGEFNSASQLGELLDPLPELALHLDIGHCNLMVSHNTTEEILARYGSRLRHVHLHDNRGGHADLHLPLGAGNIDVRSALRALQRTGYDSTITLEVFTPDQEHFVYSRNLLRRMWDELAAPAA
ncbi:MAG: sugar phosphate isomerase/epimerase family protein [Bryobacteraceae bacterium]